MAVDVHLMGERVEVERLIAALDEPLELALKARTYSMRNVPNGVRRVGEARPRVLVPGTAVAVREAVFALPLAPAENPRVRLKLTGEEADVLTVVVAARDLLHLVFRPRDFPRDGGFGVDLYLHIYTGHLPPSSPTSRSTAVAKSETPRRGPKRAASERADRRRLPGRPALPGGTEQ
jgi:hypothetical protein